MKAASWARVELGMLRKTSWKEYALRFVFGGTVCAAVGILGKLYGPVTAGLFLAFPAILPASLTLISQHEGERAAGADALGAAVGSIGLAAFGAVVWFGATHGPAWIVLLTATLVWLIMALGIWFFLVWIKHPSN